MPSQPLTPPSTSPDAEPLEVIAINTEWLIYLRGVAERFVDRNYWDVTDEEYQQVAQWAELLIEMLSPSE